MAHNERFREAVRGFYLWIGSMVILGGAPVIALNLAERETTVARISAVVIGATGSLPWMWIVYTMIRRGDEYVRRMHQVALGIAFAGSLVLITTLDWLVRVDFIEPPELMFVWIACLLIWLVALLGAKRYFEGSR